MPAIPDAINILTQDHKNVKALFKQFKKYAKAGQPSPEGKALADKILHELTVHTSIEERVFYPLARQGMHNKKGETLILEALEEHHCAKATMTELAAMDVADERFNAKMQVLSEMIIHHADEEEEDMFPQVRKALGEERLIEIGHALLAAKKTAPKQPIANEESPSKALNGLLEKAPASR